MPFGSPRPWYFTGAEHPRRDPEFFHAYLVQHVCIAFSTLSSGCRPFSCRVAEDAVFLDALALACASLPPLRRLFGAPTPLSAFSTEEVNHTLVVLEYPFQSLFLVTLTSSKPWRGHLQSLPDQSSPTFVSLQILDTIIQRIIEDIADLNDAEHQEVRKALCLLLSQFELVTILCGPEWKYQDEFHDHAKSYWKQAKEENRQTRDTWPDLCDYCSQPPATGPNGEPGQLKRCSKCVFARYCSKEHQLAAWKGESEDGETRVPHKHVCVDAKKASWIQAK